MAILEVHHIEKHFGATRVLEDISFDLEQGQALAIIGSSGSGKTTLLRCLNFLETPDQGRIIVNGETLFDAADPATQRESEVRKKRLHFGLVFQSFNLFPQYTALKNVTLARELLEREQPGFKARKKEILGALEEEGRALLAKMGLADREGHYPHQLSGGQQQRVAIARALALKPDILCFDEPTSALDPELTGEVLKVIRELAEQKTTMIIVTHEMAFARDVADEAIFMDQGVIVERGPARQLMDSPREERTRQFLSRPVYPEHCSSQRIGRISFCPLRMIRSLTDLYPASPVAAAAAHDLPAAACIKEKCVKCLRRVRQPRNAFRRCPEFCYRAAVQPGKCSLISRVKI